MGGAVVAAFVEVHHFPVDDVVVATWKLFLTSISSPFKVGITDLYDDIPLDRYICFQSCPRGLRISVGIVLLCNKMDKILLKQHITTGQA